ESGLHSLSLSEDGIATRFFKEITYISERNSCFHVFSNESFVNRRASDDTQQNCPKAFGSCLIPPVIWISILLFEGDFVACAMTGWKGMYVFDKELNRSWCKPTEKTQNETALRDLTRKYIHQSQFSAYVLIAVFSALVIIVVGVYDCCISGKCESCSSHLLSCWRPTEEVQSVGQDNVGRDSVRLGALHDTTQNQRVIPTSEEQNV
ncbi:hypothetical protein F2P79_009154, partial [Pimephales promelas]